MALVSPLSLVFRVGLSVSTRENMVYNLIAFLEVVITSAALNKQKIIIK